MVLMGRQADVVALGTIASSWGNAVRDTGVIWFASAAERTSQWPSPHEGAMSYLQDTNTYYSFDGAAWQPFSSGGGAPSGPAGGVLGGTYPNPSFAVDMATQAELNTAIAAAVNDGDAAGGDLSGTYPNPSVVDDSHAHTASTLSGVVKSGDVAGGDLSGTYPNPSVVDDSHAHTASTLSGVVKSGDAAGGDLSGTYPNPAVQDDSHSHGPSTISGSTTDGQVLRRAAGAVGWGAVDLADTDAVTGILADANIAASIARDSEVAAAYQPLDQDLTDIAGITRNRGDLIVGGASAWVDKAIGAANTLLQSDGTDPQWVAPTNLLTAAGYFPLIAQDAMRGRASSTAEQSLLNTTYDIAANTLAAGDTFLWTINGSVANSSGSAGTYTFKLKFDANAAFTFTTASIASGNQCTWNIQVFARVTSIGASGILQGGGYLIRSGNLVTTVVDHAVLQLLLFGTMDTTQALTVDFTNTNSVNHANFSNTGASYAMYKANSV